MIGWLENSPDYHTAATLIKFTPGGAVSWSKVLVSGPNGNSTGLDVIVTTEGFDCLMASDYYSILYQNRF